MFCEHDFEIIDKTILESAYEQCQKAGVDKMRASSIEDFFRKKLIIIMKCPKCRKVKKIVETNP